MIDTRHTRRVPGRGFRGDSRAAGWRPGGLRLERIRGTWRNRRHPGKTHSALGYTAHSGFREVFGSFGTRGGSEGSRRKFFLPGTRRQMANSGDIRENVLWFGTREHTAGLGWFRKGLSVGFWDTCHLPKGLRKVGCFGLVSERGFRKKLRRVAFRNDYHRWIRDQWLGSLC